MGLQVARFLMKTVSQLGSGKAPAGTTAYMGRAQHLLQCRSNVRKGESPRIYDEFITFFFIDLFS